MTFDLRILSLGAGVQSTALYLMALDGELMPKPDVAIFADTQQEPPWVYENVWRLAEEGADRIPIIIGTAGDLGEAMKQKSGHADGRFASVPFWVVGGNGKPSPGRRQCTREYKIDVVVQAIRRLLGVGFRQRATKYRVEQWVGISLDEVSRAKPSRTPWLTTRWPLLFDKPMRRYEIKAWLDRRGWPEIKKSACVFCPYRQDVEWARWREQEPELFVEAVKWDATIRRGGQGMVSDQYVSRSMVPLDQLPPLAILEKRDDSQLNLFENECEGMCGV